MGQYAFYFLRSQAIILRHLVASGHDQYREPEVDHMQSI